MALPKLKLMNMFVNPDVFSLSAESVSSPEGLSKAELKITGMVCGL